ncbi:MAG: radical SAM protein [Desulfotignum sp.]|nr:radical SAM protein [Desulfotignum sp.]
MSKIIIPSMFGGFGAGSCAGLGKLTPEPLRQQSDILSIELGKSCPLSCRHCIYQDSRKEEPDSDVLQAVATSLSNGFNPQWISISGKEPTVYPVKLIATAKKFKKLSDTHLILMTNGVLMDETLAENLVTHIDCFDVSMDGDRPAHEWMRGPGSYDSVNNGIDILIQNKAKLIGIIATAVNSILPDGRPQIDAIYSLAETLSQKYGNTAHLFLSISMYYGQPKDPFLLTAEQIAKLINNLYAIGFPAIIQIPAHYSHLWEEIEAAICFDLPKIGYDTQLAMPIISAQNLRILLPNQSLSQLAVYRVSNNGNVFAGCNHLSWNSYSNEKYCLGSIRNQPLESIINDFNDSSNLQMLGLSETEAVCDTCERYPTCRGGDKISGLYFNGKAKDPYCPKLN